MGVNVKIDLRDVYKIVARNAEQRASEFDTILINGETVRLGIRVAFSTHPIMSNVYNLSFGPIDKDGNIDDKARLSHQNHSKVFSTVLSQALDFLAEHTDVYLGIDGSNNARA